MLGFSVRWVEISETEIPNSVRFDTPRQNQGQILEVSYADVKPHKSEASDFDAKYKRIIDHSTQTTTFYRREAF